MNFADIEDEYLFVGASDASCETKAYVNPETGEIYYYSEDYQPEELPDDMEDSDKCIALTDR